MLHLMTCYKYHCICYCFGKTYSQIADLDDWQIFVLLDLEGKRHTFLNSLQFVALLLLMLKIEMLYQLISILYWLHHTF